MVQQCPREDLLKPALNDFRTRVMKLPKYVTFDHVFSPYRNDEETAWFMKTKPIKNPHKTDLEKSLTLKHILQNTDGNRKKPKLRPKDYDIIVDAIARSMPIPESIVKKNSLEKKPKMHGDIENLKVAVKQTRPGGGA